MSRLSRLFPRLFRSNKDKTGLKEANDSKNPQCLVLFLDDTHINIPFKGGCKGHYILDRVKDHLNLVEREYFGLRYVDCSGQTHWLDCNKSLASQLKGCSLPYTFYFGVKFYAADPCKLREEITRYLFFLQVKQDVLQGRLPVTFDEVAELSAYAVQSELGDFEPKRHTAGYVSEFRFVQNQTQELEDRISAVHRRLAGQSPVHVEYRFLEKAKWLEMFGVDLHPVVGEGNVEYFLGLTPTGIVVYKNKTKIGNYFWPRITKCDFKRKIFMIKVRDKNNDEHTYAFELHTKDACKHLWKCCVEHHAFFRTRSTTETNQLNQVIDAQHTASKIFKLGSKHRYSGRNERQSGRDDPVRSSQSGRGDPVRSSQSQSVLRVPSRRQQRRIHSDSRLHCVYTEGLYITEGGPVTMVIAPEPVRPPRHRSLPELQGRESPRSVQSAPWEHNYDGGLYTSGRESPTSQRSERVASRHPSDSESGISHRRRYFPNRKGSDNESDASAPRRRRRDDSGSESDVSYRNVLQSRRSHTTNEHNTQDNKRVPLLYPFADKENQPNGSIPSLHSAPTGEMRQRRRRRRSKSPGVGKHFPEELKEHIEYGLVDTAGMSEKQLRDIAYVTVQTKGEPFKIRYSPKSRNKIKMVRRKSLGDTDRGKAVGDRYETQSTGGYRSCGQDQSNRTSLYENNRNAQNTENNKRNYEQISSSPVVQAPLQSTQPARISNSSVRPSTYSHTQYNREETRAPDYEVIRDSPRSQTYHSDVKESPQSQNIGPRFHQSPQNVSSHRQTESGIGVYNQDNYVAHRWRKYHKYKREENLSQRNSRRKSSRGVNESYRTEPVDSEKRRNRPPPPSPPRQPPSQHNSQHNSHTILPVKDPLLFTAEHSPRYQSPNYPPSRQTVEVRQYSSSHVSNYSYQNMPEDSRSKHTPPQISQQSSSRYVPEGPQYTAPQTANHSSYQQQSYRQSSISSVNTGLNSSTTTSQYRSQSQSGVSTSRYTSPNVSSAARHSQPSRPSPATSDKSGQRAFGRGSNSEAISQLLRSPGYNPDLCTEL